MVQLPQILMIACIPNRIEPSTWFMLEANVLEFIIEMTTDIARDSGRLRKVLMPWCQPPIDWFWKATIWFVERAIQASVWATIISSRKIVHDKFSMKNTNFFRAQNRDTLYFWTSNWYEHRLSNIQIRENN